MISSEKEKHANLFTPAFVVPLGKSLHEVHDTERPGADDVKIVDDFRAIMDLYSVGTPEYTYCTALLASALMIKKGINTKVKRRDSLLEDLEKRRDEVGDRIDQRDRFWEIIRAGKDLLLMGGFCSMAFLFSTSMPIFAHVLKESNETFGTIASTIGGVMIWSAVRKRLDQIRSAKATRYYRWMANRIWRQYRLGIKREYHDAITTVNIAWKQMTGEHPQDVEISRQIFEALLKEGEEYDELNGDGYGISFRDIAAAIGFRRGKKPRGSALSGVPTAEDAS